MSSDYYVLCLSHDPAIRIDPEFASPNDALAAAAKPAEHQRLAEHVGCDLLVGRYSAPLIEAACPGGERCRPGFHTPTADTWTDVGWLRMLHRIYSVGIDVSPFGIRPCWTRDRVLRLARELQIEVPQ